MEDQVELCGDPSGVQHSLYCYLCHFVHLKHVTVGLRQWLLWGGALISLKNSGRFTLVSMESGGPGGSDTCGPGRHCALTPPTAVSAQPQPRLFSPCKQRSLIHHCVLESGPGESQGAGMEICRHRQQPRLFWHLLGAFNVADEECRASARELTVPVDVFICWDVSR